MSSIIVPTDFSQASVNAAHYATHMAMHLQADIILLHMLPLPLAASEMPLPPDSFEISLEESGASLKALKEELVRPSNDKLCITYRVATGSFQEEIKNITKEREVFAVVMGTSGRGAAETFFLGSFSLIAARHLECPLILIPPGYTYKTIGKVGLACDMRNVLDTLPIKGIRTLMEHYEARLEVLYVSKPDENMFPEVLRESKFLQIALAHYRPDIRITTHEDIQEGLEDFVRKSGIDLLLLLPKERGFVESIFHKSITKKMVLRPGVPLMIVHC